MVVGKAVVTDLLNEADSQSDLCIENQDLTRPYTEADGALYVETMGCESILRAKIYVSGVREIST